jgi:hypothetical protein
VFRLGRGLRETVHKESGGWFRTPEGPPGELPDKRDDLASKARLASAGHTSTT